MSIPIQYQAFVANAQAILSQHPSVVGITIAGSWGRGTADEYSDIDLIVAVDDAALEGVLAQCPTYLEQFGDLLCCHLHHADRRIWVCLYDAAPLLIHADIKWMRLSDFHIRVENPIVLWERNQELTHIIETTPFLFPIPNFQDIEDKIWTWFHYSAAKIGRGELLEAIDYLTETRIHGLSLLFQIKHGRDARRLRKVETLPPLEVEKIAQTIAPYHPQQAMEALYNSIYLYIELRNELKDKFGIIPRTQAEKRCLEYCDYIKEKMLTS